MLYIPDGWSMTDNRRALLVLDHLYRSRRAVYRKYSKRRFCDLIMCLMFFREDETWFLE